MKTKMFKRVFAAMLAASSVMAMSGVAMAAKKAPGSEKSHGASKTPAQSARKVMKLKKIKARGKGKSKKDKQFKQQEGCNICKNEQVNALNVPDDVTSKSYAKEGVIATKITSSSPIENSDNLQLDIYNKPVETFDELSDAIFDAYDEDTDKIRPWDITGVFYTAVMGEEDMLSQDCCNDEFVLKTTNRIRSLKHNHLMHDLKNCREDQELELVNALISWAKSDNITVKRNIAVAIGDLTQGGFFDDLSREKEQDVLVALVNCFDRDPSIKTDVAWAFKRLVYRGFVNENENLKEVLRLQEILNDCKDSCDVEPHIDFEPHIDIDNHCDFDSRNYNESESVDLPSETPPNSIYIPR